MTAVSGELVTASQEPVEAHEVGKPPRPWALAIIAVLAFACVAAIGVAAEARFGPSGPDESLRDEFSVDSSDALPRTDVAWVAERGSFRSADGAAWVAEPNPAGPRTMTVADIGAVNAEISVTAGQMANGWGIVFRYHDPSNFWFVQAAPDYAVFSVYRVAGGTAERVAATSLVELRDGMTVDVALQGRQVSVSVSGREIFRRDDDHGFGSTGAGLLAGSDAITDGSWSAFAVTPFDDLPAPATVVLRPTLAPATTTPAAVEAPATTLVPVITAEPSAGSAQLPGSEPPG